MPIKKTEDCDLTKSSNVMTVHATLVAISEDAREIELLTLFRSADERGKHCMISLARAMPCMRGG